MNQGTAQQVVDRTHEVTAFFEHAEWTGVTSEDRDPWLEMRRTMLTASDFAAVMGEDEYDNRTPLAVYVDKVCPPPEEKLGLDDARLWGLVLEQPILSTVAKYHGWKYRPCGALLRSRKYPFIGATLDAEVDRGAGWLPFEGKTTRVPKGWNEDQGLLPTRVLIQAQAQLLVTGAETNIVFALLQGSRPCQVEVHAQPEFHEIMAEVAETFLRRVRDLDPPPPTPGRSEKASLARLYGSENGEILALPPEAVEWTEQYQRLGVEIREKEKLREHYGDLLRASIGEAAYGVLPMPVGGKKVWRWQTEKRAAYTVAASESRKLLALKEIK